MRICVTTIYTDNMLSIAQITAFDNFKRYCDINGYDLRVIHLEDNLDRPAAWYKVSEVKRLIEGDEFEWIFFIDVDCLFMTPTIKLESFIDDNHFLVIPSNGDVLETPIRNKYGSDGVASCQFLIKSCDKSIEFLDDVWSAIDVGDELINNHDWEQRQFKYSVVKPQFESGVNIVEEKLFNRYWYTNNVFLNFSYSEVNKNIWEVGDFIAHVPGYHREERRRILEELNILSGGVISKFERVGNKITFAPMIDLNSTVIRIYINDIEVSHYTFESLNHKYEYYIIVNSDEDLVLKTFDGNNKLIGIKRL